MKAKRGFTLVEILIVVVILGILAAIVIPQFTEASTEAKLSSLCSDLQTMRSQIELYKVQHNNDAVPAPEAGGATWNRLTQKTTLAGVVDAAGTLGPYLQQIPLNPFNNLRTIDADGGAGSGTECGWYFNTTTGEVRADDTTTATPAHSTY
jgi:general secretion pathway protein G